MSAELRDRFFAVSAGQAPAGQADRFRARVDATDAEPVAVVDGLAAVFADPGELSFRTFENILPLDGLFAGLPLEAELAGRVELAEDVFSFSLRLSDPARSCLERLDSLGLYVPPLNAASRGGSRWMVKNNEQSVVTVPMIRSAH